MARVNHIKIWQAEYTKIQQVREYFITYYIILYN